MTSFQDQMTSPTAQLRADRPSRAHAIRTRLLCRHAANPQLPAAMNAATASPMSSMPIVTSSLTQRLAVEAVKGIETITAEAAGAAEGPQPALPRPAAM